MAKWYQRKDSKPLKMTVELARTNTTPITSALKSWFPNISINTTINPSQHLRTKPKRDMFQHVQTPFELANKKQLEYYLISLIIILKYLK